MATARGEGCCLHLLRARQSGFGTGSGRGPFARRFLRRKAAKLQLPAGHRNLPRTPSSPASASRDSIWAQMGSAATPLATPGSQRADGHPSSTGREKRGLGVLLPGLVISILRRLPRQAGPPKARVAQPGEWWGCQASLLPPRALPGRTTRSLARCRAHLVHVAVGAGADALDELVTQPRVLQGDVPQGAHGPSRRSETRARASGGSSGQAGGQGTASEAELAEKRPPGKGRRRAGRVLPSSLRCCNPRPSQRRQSRATRPNVPLRTCRVCCCCCVARQTERLLPASWLGPECA